MATHLYILYLAADESISGREFFLLIPKSPQGFKMGGRWPYSWCLVGCCRQDLFNIAGSAYLLKTQHYVVQINCK